MNFYTKVMIRNIDILIAKFGEEIEKEWKSIYDLIRDMDAIMINTAKGSLDRNILTNKYLTPLEISYIKKNISKDLLNFGLALDKGVADKTVIDSKYMELKNYCDVFCENNIRHEVIIVDDNVLRRYNNENFNITGQAYIIQLGYDLISSKEVISSNRRFENLIRDISNYNNKFNIEYRRVYDNIIGAIKDIQPNSKYDNVYTIIKGYLGEYNYYLHRYLNVTIDYLIRLKQDIMNNKYNINSSPDIASLVDKMKTVAVNNLLKDCNTLKLYDDIKDFYKNLLDIYYNVYMCYNIDKMRRN